MAKVAGGKTTREIQKHLGLIAKNKLSSGFLTKCVSKQSPKLQRLARKLKCHCTELTYDTFQKANNKGADQSARMQRLVCACVVPNTLKTGFLPLRPI